MASVAPRSGRAARGAPTGATNHAVDRYIERHRPGWTFKDAKQELMREAQSAVIHEADAGSEPIWRTQRGTMLVVRLDGTISTVLPMGSQKPNRRPRR